jgi:hypothetical protein
MMRSAVQSCPAAPVWIGIFKILIIDAKQLWRLYESKSPTVHMPQPFKLTNQILILSDD